MISICKRNDKPNKQGLYAVRLRVCKEGQRKYIALKIFADNDSWDAESGRFYIQRNVRGEQQKARNEQYRQYNYFLDQYMTRAQEIINDFQRERVDWTLNQFEDAFRNRSKQASKARSNFSLTPIYRIFGIQAISGMPIIIIQL